MSKLEKSSWVAAIFASIVTAMGLVWSIYIYKYPNNSKTQHSIQQIESEENNQISLAHDDKKIDQPISNKNMDDELPKVNKDPYGSLLNSLKMLENDDEKYKMLKKHKSFLDGDISAEEFSDILRTARFTSGKIALEIVKLYTPYLEPHFTYSHAGTIGNAMPSGYKEQAITYLREYKGLD